MVHQACAVSILAMCGMAGMTPLISGLSTGVPRLTFLKAATDARVLTLRPNLDSMVFTWLAMAEAFMEAVNAENASPGSASWTRASH